VLTHVSRDRSAGATPVLESVLPFCLCPVIRVDGPVPDRGGRGSWGDVRDEARPTVAGVTRWLWKWLGWVILVVVATQWNSLTLMWLFTLGHDHSLFRFPRPYVVRGGNSPG
jgi:hypothetical protein